MRLVAHMLGQLDLHRSLHQAAWSAAPTARRAPRSPPRSWRRPAARRSPHRRSAHHPAARELCAAPRRSAGQHGRTASSTSSRLKSRRLSHPKEGAGGSPGGSPPAPTSSGTLARWNEVFSLVVGMNVPFARARGRNAGCPAPPAQIPASGTTALGSSLGFERRSGLRARDERSGETAAIDVASAASAPRSVVCAGYDAEAP